MTRPEIIRADSIDLQDQDAPSAKDHTRQPAHPKPLGAGPPAPHQAEALREVAAEAAEQNQRSPRVSKEWTNGAEYQQYGDEELAAGVTSSLTGANLQQQDALAIAQNGGHTGSTAEDAEMADAEGDDGMDDDMMDKISSSPSIDDGGYFLPPMWPLRSDSLSRGAKSKSSPSFSQACGESSSPFVETPEYFPLRQLPEPIDKDAVQVLQANKVHHHSQGEYLDPNRGKEIDCDDEATGNLSPPLSDVLTECMGPWVEHYDEDYELDDLSEQILSGISGFRDHFGHDDDDDKEPCSPHSIPCDEYEKLPPIPYQGVGGLPMTPYEESEDDDGFNVPFTDDSRFIDSGWGGECLQELEDIDFEFVYALHTFVATVEGQANATKGDTMVLLDDSNSYWWLVRVVKDSSIGYLPAEHIETPTERLARLNKHRNIDLTSAMLGDQAEKIKNPLKKAIRRRNAKTVAFAAPTYVEASDIDYSTDEEDVEDGYFGQNGVKEPISDEKESGPDEDEIVAIEPLKPRAALQDVKQPIDDTALTVASSDASRTSDEIFEGQLESRQSKNGTVRNTDSFFKDDSVETRKITITPNLLRDDSSTSTRTSNDSKELKQRPSLDKLEKDAVADKSKDKKDKREKKEKEKKPGMLSGLFKRKDKKSKLQDEDVDELIMGKRSEDNSRTSPSPSKDSEEAREERSEAPTPDVQRHPSKLQKQPRTEVSPVRKPAQSKAAEPQQASAPDRPTPVDAVQQPSMRLVQPETDTEEPNPRGSAPDLTRGPAPITAAKEQKSGGTISKILRSASTSNSDPKPVKAKKAKSRVELDDFDSSPEQSPVEERSRELDKQPQRPIPGSFPDSYASYGQPSNERNDTTERLSESPVQVSPFIASQSYPPPLMVDTSSQEEAASPVSSPSPELIDAEDAREKKGSSTTSTSTATWSDTNLRTFFDDAADIKDLLVVVYDKTGVVPAGPDHPITGNLFKDENAKLADITNRLDGMLGDWLSRKMRAQASR